MFYYWVSFFGLFFLQFNHEIIYCRTWNVRVHIPNEEETTNNRCPLVPHEDESMDAETIHKKVTTFNVGKTLLVRKMILAFGDLRIGKDVDILCWE